MRQNFGLTIPGKGPQYGDFDYSGGVGSPDFQILRADFGKLKCVVGDNEILATQYDKSSDAWDNVLAFADMSFSDRRFCDQGNDDDQIAVAKAYAWLQFNRALTGSTPTNGYTESDLRSQLLTEFANVTSSEEYLGSTHGGCGDCYDLDCDETTYTGSQCHCSDAGCSNCSGIDTANTGAPSGGTAGPFDAVGDDLASARNLGGYAVAADVLEYDYLTCNKVAFPNCTHPGPRHAGDNATNLLAFREWMADMVQSIETGRTNRTIWRTMTQRANNFGAWAMASIISAAQYLDRNDWLQLGYDPCVPVSGSCTGDDLNANPNGEDYANVVAVYKRHLSDTGVDYGLADSWSSSWTPSIYSPGISIVPLWDNASNEITISSTAYNMGGIAPEERRRDNVTPYAPAWTPDVHEGGYFAAMLWNATLLRAATQGWPAQSWATGWKNLDTKAFIYPSDATNGIYGGPYAMAVAMSNSASSSDAQWTGTNGEYVISGNDREAMCLLTGPKYGPSETQYSFANFPDCCHNTGVVHEGFGFTGFIYPDSVDVVAVCSP